MRTSWPERRRERVEAFWRYRYGWRQRPCGACAGSGRYDHDGSPPCGACDGSGRELYRSEADQATARSMLEWLGFQP